VELSRLDFLLELRECAAVMYASGFLCLFLAQLLEVPEQRFAFQTVAAIRGQVIPQAFYRGQVKAFPLGAAEMFYEEV
jgi:hypothetical protein